MIFRLKFSRLLLLFSAFLLPTFTTATFAANRVTLTAEPSEVAAGSGSGKTRIRWETEGVEEAKLFVVKEDNSLVQVGKGRAGVYQENYIFPNQTYEYRLYPADNSDVPLAAVTVVGTQKVNYSPDFQTFNQKLLTPWGLPLIVIFALLFGARYLARRQKRLKLQKVLITSALFLAVAGATVVIGRARAVPYEIQPSPDAQETMDAARQMFEGNGYVTFYHENKAQPPRYPPSFSIALLPFASFGEYPTNIMFGAKFFALLYLAMAIFAAWMLGGRMAAMLAALPNIILYPLILLGVFWIFAPPFVPLYGLWATWKNRREPAAKFTIWLSGFSVLLFTFYFYQAARFMAAVSTVLLVFAAVELGKKLQRFIQPVSTSDSVPHLRETQADGDKNFVNSQTN